MDWQGWITFGFVATIALTATMVAAQMAGLSRMDIPLMLGTMRNVACVNACGKFPMARLVLGSIRSA